MGCYGIVAEFNPFHNGHKALIDEVRSQGHRCIAVMSGNFVQRAEAAITEKRLRAFAALESGCDLVLELPVAYATASASYFARGAVASLSAFGCDGIAFGSECGDPALLWETARALEDSRLGEVLRQQMQSGITFAKARQQAVELLFGHRIATVLETPNNLLAVEYLRAMLALGWQGDVLTIPRCGIGHDAAVAAGAFASASRLRTYSGDWEEIRPFVPVQAYQIYRRAEAQGLWPLDSNKFAAMMLSYLRRLSPADLAELPDLSEGIAARMHGAIRQASTLPEMQQLLKTKRYPMSRVRRLLLAAFLGIWRQDVTAPPPYLRILGMTGEGARLAAATKERRTLPLDTSLARLQQQGGTAARFAALEALATDLYTAALPRPLACGFDYSQSAVFPGKAEPLEQA